MSWTWPPLAVVAVLAAAAVGTFLDPPQAVGAGMALLAVALLMRARFPPPTVLASFRPRSLVEWSWTLVWIWEGAGFVGALMMREALYFYSLISVLVAVSLAAVAVVSYLNHRGDYLSGVPAVPKILLMATIVAILAILFGPVRPEDGLTAPLGMLVSMFATGLSVVLCYKQIASAPRSLALAAQALTVGAVVTVLALVMQGGLQMGRFGDEAVLHPNSVAGLCGAVAILLLGTWRRVGKWWLVPALGLVMAALFLTFSKTSLLALATALVAWSVLSTPVQRMWRTTVLGMVLLAVLLLAGERFIDYLNSYLHNPYGAATLSGRTQLWEATARLALERPLIGYGYGLFPEVVAQRALEIRWNVSGIAHAHNSLLTVLLEMGVAGVLLLASWVVVTVKGLLARVRSGDRSPETTTLVMLAVFILVRSLTEGSLAFRSDVPLFLLVSLAVSRWRLANRSGAGQGQSAPRSESTEDVRTGFRLASPRRGPTN